MVRPTSHSGAMNAASTSLHALRVSRDATMRLYASMRARTSPRRPPKGSAATHPKPPDRPSSHRRQTLRTRRRCSSKALRVDNLSS